MKIKLAAVAGMAMLAMAWSNSAEAYQYVVQGTITGTSNNQNVDGSSLIGKPLSITFSGGFPPPSQVGPGVTELSPGLSSALITGGGYTGSFHNDYLPSSLIQNNGSTSSLGLHIATSSNSFGPFVGFDGGLDLFVSSNLANIPLDPEQSFGPIAVAGEGSFGSPSSTGTPSSLDGYSVFFSITSLQGIGSISVVPLPAAAPLFGAALMALAGIGYGVRRKTAMGSAAV